MPCCFPFRRLEAALPLSRKKDQVLGTNKEFLVGTWIQRAIDLGEAYDEDDFSKDMLERNARALITTWGSYEMSSLIFSHDGVNYSGGTLQDYANRQYAGLTKDYYYPRWEKWISSLRETFDEEDYEDYTFDEGFELGWNWSLDHNAYTTEASGNVKELAKKIFAEYGLNDDFRIHIDITDENGMKLSEQEIFAHRDIPADIVLDLDENKKITGIEAGDVRYSMDGNILHVEEIEKDAVITVIVAAAIADRSELNEAITAAKALHGKDHTADSWTAMQKALAAAEQVAADDSATQEQIDDAADALNTAIGALQAKASDAAMAALQNIVGKATALQEDSLAEHIANAQTLLDDPDNASVNAVISVMLDLSEAMAELNESTSTDALREDVQATIDFINENILNDVEGLRPGKVQALKDAITAAQKLLANEDAAADQLKAANKVMTKAAQELWEIVTKAELEALIEAANGYLDGDYTAESLEALQTAIEAAQTVAINDDATTSEVTDAITSLANAIASLEEITLDTSALAHEIELATEMAANIDDYVPSTVEGLADKLADAQNVLTNATSQEEIDAATETLREARLNARTKADVSALEELAAYVNSLDLSGYSQLSVQRLQAALSAANTLMDDEEASQEAIHLAEYTLQKALDELTQEEAEENIVPKPAGTQSGSAVQSTDADEQETTAADVTTSASASTSSYALIFTLLAAGGILLITHKKRQR